MSSAVVAVDQSRSEAPTGNIWCASGVHGLDDLAAVDAL
jgi:hypothetical protein